MKNISQQDQQRLQGFVGKTLKLAIVPIFLIVGQTAFASTLPGAFSWVSQVQGWFQGPVGQAFGIIATVVSAGTIALTKGNGVSGLVWVFISLGLMAGAATLVSTLFPSISASGFAL